MHELDLISNSPPRSPEDWSEFAFFFNVFAYMKQSIFADLVPQIVTQIIMVLLASYVAWALPCHADGDDDMWGEVTWWEKNVCYQLPADVKSMHSEMAKVLSFLLVFKSGQGYGNYLEGRKQLGGFCNNCRELAQFAYTYKLKADADMVKVEYLREVMRRKINLLLAFVRQACRESVEGFVPGCGLEDEEFSKENFYKDPCSPPIANLMSAAEMEQYKPAAPPARVAMVQTELNMLAGELSQETTSPESMYYGWMKNSEETVNLFKGALRIVTTPVPLPYVHMLYFLTMVYVYMTPFIYVPVGTGGNPDLNWNMKSGDSGYGNKFSVVNAEWINAYAWVPSMLFCMGFYGIMETAAKLHNPFGHDDIDHDMGAFNVKAHNETMVVAQLTQSELGKENLEMEGSYFGLVDYTKRPSKD